MNVDRSSKNPILTPADVKPSREDLSVIGVFNAAVARLADKVILLLRVAEEPISDDPHYSAARISTDDQTIVPVFLRLWPSVVPVLARSSGRITLFNGTSRPRVITRLEGVSGRFRLKTTDIMLREGKDETVLASTGGNLDLDHPVPVGGMLRLIKID